jgi:hypothetical protein
VKTIPVTFIDGNHAETIHVERGTSLSDFATSAPITRGPARHMAVARRNITGAYRLQKGDRIFIIDQ